MSKQNNVGAGPVSARNKQKGITLIALIITVIVMLILVGVTVSVSLNGGLFSKAKEAGDKTIIEAEKDMLRNLALGAFDNEAKVSFADLKTAVDKNGEFEEIASNKTMGVYKNKKTGNKYTVKSDGTIIEGETELPTGRWEQNGETLTYIDADGNVTSKTLKIGDKVNYIEGTSGSYTTEEDRGTYATSSKTSGTYTVDGANGTIAAGDLEWVVLGTNEAGQVELISTTPTTASLTLYGKAGYLNAVTDENGNLGTLDTFCNNLYGQNNDVAISARSVNLQDLYKAAGYNYQETYEEYTAKYYQGAYYYIKTSDITDENKDGITGWSQWTDTYDLITSGVYTPSGSISSTSRGPIVVTFSEEYGIQGCVESLPDYYLPVFGINEFDMIDDENGYFPYANVPDSFWATSFEVIDLFIEDGYIYSELPGFGVYSFGYLTLDMPYPCEATKGGELISGFNGEQTSVNRIRPIVTLTESVVFTSIDSDSDGTTDYYDIETN